MIGRPWVLLFGVTFASLSNCVDFVCDHPYTLVENPETVYCEGDPCDSMNFYDVYGCCDMKASCLEFSGECNSSHVLISDAKTTYCAGTECTLSDHHQCCVHVSSCGNFSLCDNATEYLKEDADHLFCNAEVCDESDNSTCCAKKARSCGNFSLCDSATEYLKEDVDHLLCNAEVCDESDISTCCAKKARCSSLQCDIDGGYTNIDNDENVYCERDPCDEDDSDTCCTERESLVSGGGSRMPDGAIAGIIVAVVGFVTVVGGLAYCELKPSKGSRVEQHVTIEETEELKNGKTQKIEETEQLKNL